MSEPPPIPLVYATPGDRPEQGRFTAEPHDDGVTVSRPLPATPILAVGLLFTGGLFGLWAVAAVSMTAELAPGPSWWWALAAPVVAAFAAVSLVALTHVPTTLPRLMTITVRGPSVTAGQSPHRLWGRQWTFPSATAIATRAIATRAIASTSAVNLCVVTADGRTRLLLANVPGREAAWAAGVLNAALRPLTTDAGRGDHGRP